MFPSESDSPPEKLDVIQATLIFDLPLPTPKILDDAIEEEKSQPDEPEKELLIAEPLEDSKVEPISEPEEQAIQTAPQPQPQTLLPKREEEVQEGPEQNDDDNEITPADQTFTTTPNLEINAPVTSMARRHLSSFQQQQQNKVAAQASRNYQQHKNSPVIDDEIKNPFMTEDEKLRDNLKVRADCSSTSKKTTAALLGFFGGQIDCSKPPPINGFIKDRINKKNHLPGQYRQEDQKRPQSVVIKKQP